MGRSERSKGKRGEREAARKLGELLGVPIARSQQYKGGQQSADLAGTGRLHVEVKRCERLSLYDAMTQAADDAGENIPLLLHRRNRHPWLAVVYLDDLVDLTEAVEAIRGDNARLHCE